MKLCGLVPCSYTHLFVSYFYIPRIGLPIWLQQKKAYQSWEYINRSQIHECGKWETEQYNSVLEITRPHSFIDGNTKIGTRHLYWILTSPSFAVQASSSLYTHITKSNIDNLTFVLVSTTRTGERGVRFSVKRKLKGKSRLH